MVALLFRTLRPLYTHTSPHRGVIDEYETFEDLYDYSCKVASVAGVMNSEVFECLDRKALSHAVELGIAMQLTNVLRDVWEDRNRDRIYLPTYNMRRSVVLEEDLMNRCMAGEFVEWINFQFDRAQSYYFCT